VQFVMSRLDSVENVGSGSNAPAHEAAAIERSVRKLSAAARTVATQPIAPGYSPIVLAGTVRLIELALVAATGSVLYAAYVVPQDGFSWLYADAIAAIALLAMCAFQAADIYQVQAFRGYEKQYFRLMSAWSVVFLLVIGVTFFAKIGDQFSRLWLGTFYVAGLIVLVAFRRSLFLLVRAWTREGRLDRRTAIVGADASSDLLVRSLLQQRVREGFSTDAMAEAVLAAYRAALARRHG